MAAAVAVAVVVAVALAAEGLLYFVVVILQSHLAVVTIEAQAETPMIRISKNTSIRSGRPCRTFGTEEGTRQ